MTGLDARFVPASALQEYFVDKDNGLPLAAGIVSFFSDINRTVLKDIFKISGTPPNYQYVAIDNPMTLSSVGTATDGEGNDIMPYLFPFKGTPDNNSGIIELYYITVQSAGLVPQWTREGWPNTAVSGTSISDLEENFVPNGQFLIHNNIPADDVANTVVGQITQPITDIAQGGWTFERSSGSSAIDKILFTPFVDYVDNPTASPKFACNVICQTPGTDSKKDLAVKFRDVNKFSSPTASPQQYTFAFSGITNSGSAINVQLFLIKYLGAGGSTITPQSLATFTLGNSYQIFQQNFTFGNTGGNTVGSNGDDYVQLALRMPTSSAFDISITDVMLVVDSVTITSFPPITDAMMLTQSIAGWMPVPAYDGSDLYLPLRLTKEGLTFDRGEISTIVGKVNLVDFNGTSLSTVNNEMICDGNQYETAGYSPLGIPYARLQTKIFNSTFMVPQFGTGANFVTASIAQLTTGALTEMHLAANSAASLADSVDVSTTFTITTIHPGHVTGQISGMFSSNGFMMKGTSNANIVLVPTVGTTGFTFAGEQRYNDGGAASFFFNVVAPTAGEYWTWQSAVGPINYYMWFKVNGSGADPAPGGTGIELDLLSNYTLEETTGLVCQALNGGQITKIVTVAGSSVPASSYFTFNTTGLNYYVWYTVDGVGIDPKAANRLGINVIILSTDTAVQVASKTVLAINQRYFAAPQLQGLFLRGYDPNLLWDYTAGKRFGLQNIPSFFGNILGTIETDTYQAHLHAIVDPGHAHDFPGGGHLPSSNDSFGTGPNSNGGGLTNIAQTDGTITDITSTDTAFTDITISESGYVETRPVNSIVVWVIKY